MTAATRGEIGSNWAARVRSARRRRDGPNPVSDRCHGGRMLVDVGCGFGAFLGQLHDRYDALVGIDFVPLTRAEFDNVHLVRGDLRQGLPLSGDVADTVTAIEVIEHVADPILLVQEAFRILRPGGELMLTTPNIRYVRHAFRLIVQGRGPKTSGLNDDRLLWDGGHIHYFTSKDLVALLWEAGFVSVEASALINARGFLPLFRRFLSSRAANPVVREFLTGRLLVSGKKPAEPAP